MINQIRNIFNSKESEISILVIVCCMIATNLSIQRSGNWTDVAVIASIISGLILFFLLVWATIKLITRKQVKEMPRKPRLIVESLSRLLFLYWIYITMGLIPAIVWAAFVLWAGFTSVRQLRQQGLQ